MPRRGERLGDLPAPQQVGVALGQSDRTEVGRHHHSRTGCLLGKRGSDGRHRCQHLHRHAASTPALITASSPRQNPPGSWASLTACGWDFWVHRALSSSVARKTPLIAAPAQCHVTTEEEGVTRPSRAGTGRSLFTGYERWPAGQLCRDRPERWCFAYADQAPFGTWRSSLTATMWRGFLVCVPSRPRTAERWSTPHRADAPA